MDFKDCLSILSPTSSSKIMFGFLSSTRASDIFCCSPDERFILSPVSMVSSPLGSLFSKLSSFTFLIMLF